MTNPLRVGLDSDLMLDSTTLVIFGASGDLTARKLLPGIYNLVREHALPSSFRVIGFGRRPWDDEAFRREMAQAVAQHSRHQPLDPEVWQELEPNLGYLSGSYDDPESYRRLGQKLGTDQPTGARPPLCTFYLALPPAVASTVVEQLTAAGLCDPPARNRAEPCSRVVVEKPFGHDLASAQALNRSLLARLDERQIFRIDHYLGKETVQNLLVLRFGNTIFEPLWNRDHVAAVEITVAETLGVGSRGSFYEQTGLLRDMIQNHGLQLLCLVAMEAPVAWDADAIRDEKVKVLRALRPISGPEAARQHTVRGQYGPGVVRGEKVPGYREEPQVSPRSQVETFAALRLAIDNWRWPGVPFYLRAGKRLAERVTEIVLHFRPLPHRLLRSSEGPLRQPNCLVLRIQPDEGISLSFATKVPGPALLLRDVSMDFCYGAAFGAGSPEAYERLLLDALRGDATLFTRADEAEAQWRVVDPILSTWQSGAVPLTSYPAGTWGPVEALTLGAKDGFSWSRS